MKKNLFYLPILLFCSTALSSCAGAEFLESDKECSLDEKFNFDDLDITLSSNYTAFIFQDTYSDQNGSAVIKMPVSVRNNKNEPHSLNLFYYSAYGSKNIELSRFLYKRFGGVWNRTGV